MLNVRGLAVNQMLRTAVADGDRGTAQTIPFAKQLIREGTVNPDVRLLAVQYCSGVQPNDELGEMRAIFNGVLRDFRFIKDPVGTQLLQPAAGVLETHAGNCATLNLVLFPSLLGSVGYPTRAVTIKSDPDRPSEFSHVYVEAQLSNGEWVPLDVARSNPEFGKEPEQYWARKDWPLTDGGSAGAYLNGYGGPVMRAQTQILLTHRQRSAFPRRGMGDDSGDGFSGAQALAQSLAAAPSILTGVAQVVKAQNTPGIAVSGVVGGQGTALGTSTGASGGLILLLGLGVVAWLAMKG